MYSKIKNPETGRMVKINGKVGINVLRNYIKYQEGSADEDTYSEITNPETGRIVNINGGTGKKILRKYIKYQQDIADEGKYTKACRNSPKGARLSRTGKEYYKHYKSVCPPEESGTNASGLDNGWLTNICDDKNIKFTAKNYTKYAKKYETCAKEREKFNRYCIENPDDEHTGAINKMRKYSKSCKEKAKNMPVKVKKKMLKESKWLSKYNG